MAAARFMVTVLFNQRRARTYTHTRTHTHTIFTVSCVQRCGCRKSKAAANEEPFDAPDPEPAAITGVYVCVCV
jgi:hypothetical protein